IASSSVVIASVRSALCASRKPFRSRAWPSSSSAARLTAPSASMSRLSASILPCRPASLTPPSSMLRAIASRSACAASSCSAYCAAQVLRQVVVEAAFLAEASLLLEPDRQRALQLALRRLVGELGVLRGERGVGAEVVLELLARRLDRALELLATSRERAQLELRFLRLALELALRV